MIRLSAVILTLNEERNIGRCIESLKGVADEVLVVDSLSTDRTVEIAQSLGATVIKQAFLGYIEQKNFAAAAAQYDHVLSLDADEALSDALRQSIVDVKQRFEYDGYTMNRLPNYCGQWIRHGGWYPDRKLRLFDRTKGSWQGINPHDKYVLRDGGRAGWLKGDLLHYTFYSRDEHRRQIERFTTISAKARFEQGQRSSWLKIAYKPVARFFKGFILRAGFLDGRAGWVIATSSSYATYLKYYKLLKLQQSA